MSGIDAKPEGITNPPIDTLLERVPSKYALVIYAAKRARQINSYYQQVADGMYSTPGPLLETEPDEKPLSISLREINEGLLEFRDEPEDEAEQTQVEEASEAPDFSDIELALNEE